MEQMMSILMGISFAATCGFRIFLPMLFICIAVRVDYIQLAAGFDWLGSDVALLTLLVATCLEILAFYIPWVDNLLDTVATPAAMIAGTVVSASFITDMSPFLQWSLAAIAGVGGTGSVQVTTAAFRGGSTMTTGGGLNFLVSTAEWIASIVASFLSLFLPLLAFIIVLVLVGVAMFFVIPKLLKKIARRSAR